MKQEIFIPLETISEFNVQEHWTRSYKRHRRQKQIISLSLRNATSKQLPVNILLTRHSPRNLDGDNLQGSLKYIRDAVAEHFVENKAPGRADDDPRISWDYSQTKSSEKGVSLTFTWPELPDAKP